MDWTYDEIIEMKENYLGKFKETFDIVLNEMRNNLSSMEEKIIRENNLKKNSVPFLERKNKYGKKLEMVKEYKNKKYILVDNVYLCLVPSDLYSIKRVGLESFIRINFERFIV